MARRGAQGPRSGVCVVGIGRSSPVKLEETFAKVVGRSPTDAERQRLYRLRDAVGVDQELALSQTRAIRAAAAGCLVSPKKSADHKRKMGHRPTRDFGPHPGPQGIYDDPPGPVIAPASEVEIHVALGRQVVRQHVPLATGAIEVEDGVEDLAHVVDARPADIGGGDQELDDGPLRVGEVGG